MRASRVLAIFAVTLLTWVLPTAGATASAAAATSDICSGTASAPGVLAGTIRGVVTVTGVCDVSAGPATVVGHVVVVAGGVLDATFARDDRTGNGASSLVVDGNLAVTNGGVLLLGCEPKVFPCSDDPNAATGGSLASHSLVTGNIDASGALGVVVHATRVTGSVGDYGGGGGYSCQPQGFFAGFGSPAYTDYEDDAIGGGLAIGRLQTCWLGALRNTVGGNLVEVNNAMFDRDAGEILQNTVHGDALCFGNSPPVQFGDSGAAPNIVDGSAFDECGFAVMAEDRKFGYGGRVPVSVPGTLSYWLAEPTGNVDSFSVARDLGGADLTIPSPGIVGIAAAADGRGYWLASADGRVYAFGSALWYGSEAGAPLSKPIVGIAATSDGHGYYLVAADGGVFAFGDARYLGSMGARHLNAGIVGITAAPGGAGYWLVASDGGVFAFGRAAFLGSEGGRRLNSPITLLAAHPDGRGYWLVGSDGGIFTFGAARYFGSAPAAKGALGGPVVAMIVGPGGEGYWLVDATGRVAGFGPDALAIAVPPRPVGITVAAAVGMP